MTFDENGYPDNTTISEIESFDMNMMVPTNISYYLKLIWDNWEYPNTSWKYNKNTGCLQISTCGWSGNEEVVAAMKRNYLFWTLFWYGSKRGGHYWFRIYTYDPVKLPVELEFLEKQDDK